MSSDETCRYCNAPIREVEVLVGELPAHPVTLRIDTEPHESGRVIMRRDGTFRLLGNLWYRGRNIAGYRVHSERGDCDSGPRKKEVAHGYKDDRALT